MNDTIKLYNAETINSAAVNDSTNYELCIKNYELYKYKDFKFVTEQSRPYEGPIEREVSYISAGWNFMVLFMVMIIIVMNKFFAPQRFSSIIIMPFQNGSSDKIIRENNSFFNIISFSIIVSFILLLSMLIQKMFLILGSNNILHDNLDFFMDVVTAVSAFFVFNYLLTLFYSWLFKTEILLVFHVSLHVSVMATCNVLLIPLIMVLLFYPYKFLLIISLIVVSLFFFIRFAKILIEVRMLSKLNFVNIFLYLCTVEILPVLVISKMIFMVF